MKISKKERGKERERERKGERKRGGEKERRKGGVLPLLSLAASCTPLIAFRVIL